MHSVLKFVLPNTSAAQDGVLGYEYPMNSHGPASEMVSVGGSEDRHGQPAQDSTTVREDTLQAEADSVEPLVVETQESMRVLVPPPQVTRPFVSFTQGPTRT